MKPYKTLEADNFFVSGWIHDLSTKFLQRDYHLVFGRVSSFLLFCRTGSVATNIQHHRANWGFCYCCSLTGPVILNYCKDVDHRETRQTSLQPIVVAWQLSTVRLCVARPQMRVCNPFFCVFLWEFLIYFTIMNNNFWYLKQECLHLQNTVMWHHVQITCWYILSYIKTFFNRSQGLLTIRTPESNNLILDFRWMFMPNLKNFC